jgi:2-keto-3-deoxy-L-rhamnonate aldolase RhmA
VLDLFLFTPDPPFAKRAVDAGVDGIVIDWEQAGKRERQESADTEINEDSVEDLRRVRAATGAPILCRINPIGSRTEAEIDAAVVAGADEVLVPMVRTGQDVEVALRSAAGRIKLGILIETCDAVEAADEIGALPLSRVYLGLNDLAIERGSPSIFSAVLDGTVERVRSAVQVPFGFAGMTLPDAGRPIPCRLLIGELARLRCSFTFLRRSFRRDVVGRDLRREITRMKEAVDAASARSRDEIAGDRAELERRIAELEAATVAFRVQAHA